MSDSGATDRGGEPTDDDLRDELAQAIIDAIWPEEKAAEAVLVLVEQRIAEAAAVGEDAMQTAYELGVKNAEERIAAKIEAIEHRVAQPGHTYSGVARPPARDIEAYRSDVLRVVRGDE